MKVLIILLLLISEAFALDAVVTVLETPMFKTEATQAPVVQYLRKGDVIKLHPASPTEGEFVSTFDRQGNKVYVLRDHLFIYFEDMREMDQATISKDPTDYRLEEPLPKDYPFFSPKGYRGQVVLGITQPYTESYPYESDVKQKGYQSPIDLNVTFLRETPNDVQDRFYFGGTFNFRTFNNSYLLFNGRETEERGFKLGVGPYITYDAFKGEKNRVNLYGSINVNLFNQLTITQKGADGSEDDRTYYALSLSPRIGSQYHRKAIVEDLDFVVGTYLEMEPATTYRSKNAGNQESWWRNRGSDKFNTRTTFTLAGYIGIQSAY